MTTKASNPKAAMLGLATLLALGAVGGAFTTLAATGKLGSSANAAEDPSAVVRQALAQRLPKTRVTSVDCSRLNGMCEVAAGPNLFYVDRAARYLVIGRVYDMETRQDLTAAKLLELSPDTLLRGSAAADGDGEQQAPGGGGQVRQASTTVSLAGLPTNGAIRWGGSGPKVVVFSDFHCGYCKRLTDELRQINAAVEERPISTLGSRSISEAVLCSSNPVSALHAAYAGETPVAARRCDTSGLDANEAFAKAHGFSGTPILVRADGAVLEGWRPAREIAAWLKASA